MRRRTWALVTGAIRNDLYLRIVMIKLCDLRHKGLIEQIVLSTWEGEIDKFPHLRDELKSLNIILVEKPYINETAENVFNFVAFARQRASIFYGVQVIPNGVFVLKLRTDSNDLITTRGFIKFLNSDEDISINRYGMFPVIFDSKLVVCLRSFSHLQFPEDRYFYASKEIMNKISTFVSNRSIFEQGVSTDAQITCGYIYQMYQFFRDIWIIIPGKFYDYLHAYCKKRNNEDLILPRLVHRIYATICVSLYTQYYILSDDVYTDEPIQLIDLFSDKIRTNNQIERIVMGRIVDSKLSSIFKDELRKLSLNLSETHSYTYEEYEELCKFTEEQLQKKNLIHSYPYKNVDLRLSDRTIDKREAGDILLKSYGEDEYANKIVSAIDDDFDFVSRALYLKVKRFASKGSKINIKLWKMAIYEHDIDTICEYGKELYRQHDLFDKRTFLQSVRYLGFSNLVKQEIRFIVSIYDYINHYDTFFRGHKTDSELDQQMIKAINNVRKKFHPNAQSIKKVISADEWIIFIVKLLYQQLLQEKIPVICIQITEALLIIKPAENPFSKDLIESLEKNGYKDIVKRIKKSYSNLNFNLGDWEVSSELTHLICQNQEEALLEYASKVRGKVDSLVLLKYFWNLMWHSQKEEKEKVVSAIHVLSGQFLEAPFIVKLNEFLKTDSLIITKKDMVDIENFFLLLEVLYRKNILENNIKNIMDMCTDEPWRKVISQVFLKASDNNRLDVFSMKNEMEIWLYYRPYLEHYKSKEMQVPMLGNGQTWPGADRVNESAFAAFIRLMGNDVYISVEMSATDMDKVRTLSNIVGYEEKNSHDTIIRLLTRRIPIREDGGGLARAVNEALDEFCKVGEKVVAALDGIEL